MTQKPDQCLGEWIDREALAEAMIPLIGQLYRNNNVVLSIHGRSLINRSVIEILKAHRFARHRQADESGLACLLYTSPSPRDQRGSRMPSSA